MRTCSWSRSFVLFSVLAFFSASSLAESPECLLSFDSARLNVCDGQVSLVNANLSHLADMQAFADSDIRVVKFDGPITAPQRRALASLDVEILGYAPFYGYKVRMDARLDDTVRGIPGVNWTGPYLPVWKVGINLANELLDGRILQQAPELDRLYVSLHPGVSAAQARSTLEAIPEVTFEFSGTGHDHEFIVLGFEQESLATIVDGIAVNEGINALNFHWPNELMNSQGAWLHQSGESDGPDNLPIFEQGIFGCGQITSALDSGLFAPNCAFEDTVFGPPVFDICGAGAGCPVATPDFNHRKVGLHYQWRDSASAPGDNHGHGTFVAGNMIGNNHADAVDCQNFTSPGGVTNLDGMAPGAKFIIQEAGGNLAYLNTLGGTLYHAATTAHANDAYIHNNSWGSSCRNAFGGCVAGCIVEYRPHSRGGDMAVWEYPELLIFAAAGNSGGGDGNSGCGPGADVGAPGNAKNIFSIGANQRGTLGNNMAGFSSRGPASDRRTKPDMVAQGQDLISPDRNACGTRSSSGTSFSSPTAAGMGALVREYLQRGFYPLGIEDPGSAIPNPSAALIKAIMINGSTQITGTGTGSGFPNQNQGFGRILLENSLYFDGDDRKLWLHDGTAGLDTSDVDSHVVVALDGQPLAVTLVWHDFPAEENADPHIVNSLRLEVEDPNGQVWTQKLPPGGGLTNPNPFQGTSLDDYDDRNTVHQILFDAPVSGSYQVRVRAIQVAMGDAQPYALAITGDLGGFSIDPPSAEVCAAEGSTDFTLTLSAQFEGTTNLSVTGEPAGTSGSFSVNPVVFPDDESVYTLSGLAGANGGEYTLEFTATDSVDPGNTATVGAGLALYEDTADAITLLTPADQTTNTDLRPEFTWNVADASDYQLQVATDAGFTSLVIDETLSGTSFTPGFDLATGTDFFWRVRGNNACGEGDWSAVFEFQTRFEPIADISPASFSFTVQTGTTESQPLFIENTGTGELAWQIGTDEITGDCTSPAPVPWLSGDPASGSTPPGPPAEPDIIVDGNLLTHGQHEANLCVTTNTTTGPQLVVIPVFVNAIDPNIAFLEGNVTSLGLCDADGGPLEGALVSVQGQDNLFEAFTDEDGFYSFEISDSESPVEMTVSAELHATEVRPNVVLTGGQLNIEDFDLDGDSACIEVAPDQISVTLELNQSDSDTLEISNVGTQTLDWEILFSETTGLSAARNNLLIGGVLLIPDSTNDRVLAFDPETGDLLDENFVPPQTETLGTIQHMLLHPDNERLLLSTQTQHVVWSFDLEGNLLGPFSPPGGADTTLMQNLRGMDYHPDTGHLLVTVSAGGNADSIVEVDLDGNVLGTFIDPGAGGLSNPWDLEFRADDVLVLGVISGGIWRFDHSGAPLGTWGPPLSFPRQIVELANGNLLVTNSSGAGTTGVYEFDADGNQLLYLDVAAAARGVYELGNGNLLISNASGVHEIDRDNNLVETKFTAGSHHLISFVKFFCDDVSPSWLSVDPGSGSISSGGPATTVTVTFDADGLAPGTYSGELCIDSNDPVEPRVQVPVSMEVVLPGDFATIEGTVQTAGFCGAGELAPLAGATVDIDGALDSYQLTTDANGFYQIFLSDSESPIDITVTAPDHLDDMVTGVNFTGGDLVVNDFDLEGDSACIGVDPEEMSATLPTGETADEEIDISNFGSQTLNWEIDTTPGAMRGTSDPLIGFTLKTAASSGPDPQNWTRISTSSGMLDNVPDDSGAATDVSLEWGLLSGTMSFIAEGTVAADAVPQYGYDLTGMNGYGFGSTGRYFFELSGLRPNAPYELWFVGYRNTLGIEQTVEVSEGDDPSAIQFDQVVTSAANNGRFIVNEVVADDTMHWDDLALVTTSSSSGTIRIEVERFAQSTSVGAFAIRQALDCEIPEWLSFDPLSGSVASGGPAQTVTATFDADGLFPGVYEDAFCVNSNDPVRPQVLVPVSMEVTQSAGVATVRGTVQSAGFCGAGEFTPLEGATVEITGQTGTFTDTTDEDGFYEILLDVTESPVDITGSAPDHLDETVTDVALVGGGVVVQDFDLAGDSACIDVDPEEIDTVLESGQSEDHFVDISNLGTQTLDWTIFEPAAVTASAPTISADQSAELEVMMPRGGFSDSLIGFNFTTSGSATPDPQNWTRISAIDGVIMDVPDDTGTPTGVNIEWGGVTSAGFTYLGTSTLGPGAVPQYDYDLSGMTGYGFRAGGHLFVELSGLQANSDYEFWFVAYRSVSAIGNLVEVMDGDANVQFDFLQEITSGDNDGRFVINEVVGGDTQDFNDLSLIATSDGNGVIRFEWTAPGPGTAVIGALAIRQHLSCEQPDWLSVAPASGTINPGDLPDEVTVTLNAAGLGPGLYEGAFCVESNDPLRPLVPVPVTMEVTLPADFATIEGTVEGSGYCNADPGPLAGATVTVEGQINTFVTTTDADGFYQVFLHEDESAADITAEAPGYIAGTETGVTFTGGDVVVQDFDLLFDAPCATADPDSFDYVLFEGQMETQTLTIGNVDGNVDLDWDALAPVGAGVLYDNGPFITHPGAGPGGSDHSRLQNSSLGMSTLGGNVSPQAGDHFRIADDFTVNGDWQIDTITFFAYQTDSPTTSTFTHVNYRVWDGPPNDPASNVVFGDTTTNMLLSTAWINAYRVSETTMNTARPIMEIVADGGFILTPGTYWLDWQLDGSLASGPWQPPITITGEDTTGNALQLVSDGWQDWIDGNPDAVPPTGTHTPQGAPFVISGTAGCWNPGGVDWLDVVPSADTVAAGASQAVDVIADATGQAPGDYVTNICLSTSDAMAPVFIIPVTLTVPDPSLGDLEGTVTSAGHCGADPHPVAGAMVTVTGQDNTFQAATDGNGFYSLDISEDESPVDITVTAGGYLDGSATGVVITATQTTVEDFDLVLDAPCATVDPDSLEAEVGPDGTASRTLTIGNVDGGADLNWTIEQALPPDVSGGAVGYAYGVVDFEGNIRTEGVSGQIHRGGETGDVVMPFDGDIFPMPQGGPIGDDFEEGFEDITLLPGAGWAMINNSTSPGTVPNWVQGSTSFDAHAGPPNSLIGSSFNAVAGSGDLSHWLITPEIVLQNGTEMRFWTRTTVQFQNFNDRLEVRLSTAGASTDVGSTPQSVGDFDELLLTINPDLQAGVYPEVWTEFVLTVEGLGAPTSGRFAFRHWVPNAGPAGANGDFIGIDTFSIMQPEGGCAVPEDVSWLSTDPDGGSTPAGGTSNVAVNFDAAGLAPGDYEALLCVSSNDPVNPLIDVPVTLTVLDQDPAILEVDPTALDFGEVVIDTSATMSFEVSNAADAGAATLMLSAITAGGDAEFDVTGGTCAVGSELEPGDSCTVEVSFSPTAAGGYSGTVTVEGNNESAEVALTGTGIELDPGDLHITPAEMDFGAVDIGTTATGVFTLKNEGDEGNAAVLVDSILVLGHASFQDTGNGTCEAGVTVLEPGDECTIEVSFTPPSVGGFAGSVVVDGADGKKATASLSGSGVEPEPPEDDIFADRFEEQ